MKKIVNFLKNNKYFFVGMVILSWVVFINLFPRGYVFGGGDTIQLIGARDSFNNLFFDWQGRAGFFYGIFYLLSLAGISDSNQLSFYLGFIIFGSFISFQIFSKLVFSGAMDLSRSLISLFYSLNLYTLFLFTGNWGYSYFPSLYVFLPVLTGLLIKFLQSQKIVYGAWFCLVLFLGSSGFANPAFALSLAIFFLGLIIFLGIIKYIKFSQILAGKIILIVTVAFLISSSWILPLLPNVRSGVEALDTTNIIDFDSWIRSTSSPLAYTLSLRHFSNMHFPQNFYYKEIDYLKNLFITLAFLPILLIVWGLTKINKLEKNKKIIFFSLLALFLLFVMLVARVRPPFETINYHLYHFWGFNVLRGYDKTAIYIPFFLSGLLTLVFTLNRKWIYCVIILALLAPLPFYAGKIQQTAGYRVDSNKDYTRAKMSFLVKIPNEYYQIKKILNSDLEKSQIGILPATYSDGSGIVYYPKWELYGADITQFLYTKEFIYQNLNYFSNWNIAQNFKDEITQDNSWIVKLLGMMNARYILFHKDAPDDAVEKTLSKMKDLENRGLVGNLEENDYFILYEISKDYFMAYLSWQNGNPEIQGNIASFERNYPKVKNNSSAAEFQEINPKKFEINLSGGEIGENLILAETFSPLWKAYYKLDDGKEIEIKDHFKARGYANGWKLTPPENTKRIIVEYYPIRLMWRGMWVSGITVVFLLGYLACFYVKRLKNWRIDTQKKGM